MKLRSPHAWPVAIGALAAAATIAMAPAIAAPPKPTVDKQTTIYSETFTPLKRFPDGDSLDYRRYYSGPGNSPNLFRLPKESLSGLDAFFNTPDLTIGTDQMSAVSAEVCLTFNGDTGEYDYIELQFGVQDKDRNFVVWEDPENPGVFSKHIVPSAEQQCEKLTFAKPVKLVNHPHLVTALIIRLVTEDGDTTPDSVEVDGVTYTLQPSRRGDLTPKAP